ncbi:unnamed protein product [Calypogeia fissa]
MLDILLFREGKPGDPEKIRESQRRRYAKVELVDEVIELDKAWRQRTFELEQLKKERNRLSKEAGKKIVTKEDPTEIKEQVKALEKSLSGKSTEVQEAKDAVDSRIKIIGNLVHDSVVVDDNEDHNQVVKRWGTAREEAGLKNHVDLVDLLRIADLAKGADTAGGRGYYLKGAGVLLNQALINFGLAFLYKRNYTPLQTPFFMRKDVMGECAQLAQFDEELYKVTGDGDDKYLIATSEQPLCAYHRGDWVDPKSLPLRYAGYSTCFRKEAGAHGRDTTGIFRVHQFEKIEQFCVTSPKGNDSWEMHEEMLKNSEDFYQQSNDTVKQYVHLLNSTLVATERTICCILENYQTKDGVKVPEVLQPFMNGIDFIPFQSAPAKAAPAKAAPTKAAKQ